MNTTFFINPSIPILIIAPGHRETPVPTDAKKRQDGAKPKGQPK